MFSLLSINSLIVVNILNEDRLTVQRKDKDPVSDTNLFFKLV